MSANMTLRQNWTKCASKISDGVRIETTRDAEDIKKKMESLEAALNEHERR
jgi:hypothetical protein